MEGKAVLFMNSAASTRGPSSRHQGHRGSSRSSRPSRRVRRHQPEDIPRRVTEIEGAAFSAELDIPAFHDDQHGTAIGALRAINALKIVGQEDRRRVPFSASALPVTQSSDCCLLQGARYHRLRRHERAVRRRYSKACTPSRAPCGDQPCHVHGSPAEVLNAHRRLSGNILSPPTLRPWLTTRRSPWRTSRPRLT